MPERTVQIANRNGLHARPAAEIVKLAAKFQSEITIVKDDLDVNGKSIMKRARPLTHDLCKTIITGLGATLKRVQITRVENNTYYGELLLERDGNSIRVDSRPSDAIAIALRLEAPIFAAESLLMSTSANLFI